MLSWFENMFPQIAGSPLMDFHGKAATYQYLSGGAAFAVTLRILSNVDALHVSDDDRVRLITGRADGLSSQFSSESKPGDLITCDGVTWTVRGSNDQAGMRIFVIERMETDFKGHAWVIPR